MPGGTKRVGGVVGRGRRQSAELARLADPELEAGTPLGLAALLLGGAGFLALPGLRAASFLGGELLKTRRSRCEGAIPRLKLSGSLGAKVVVDEAVRALMLGLVRCPSRAQRARIRDEVSTALDLYARRGWMARPERFHRPPPPLRRPRITQRRAAGIDFEHLEFRSGYRPRDGEPGRNRWLALRANRTAHAWVMRHRGAPRPWLISIPGYRMGHPALDLSGLRAHHHHFDLGFNVLIPVLPLHGPRSAGRRSGDGFITPDALNTIHAEAQAMWDIRRMLSWIRAEGAAGVGVFGVSLGGYNAALLASLERGLACVIAGIPASCFPSLLDEHAPRFLMRLGERLGLPWDDMRRIMRVVSPLQMRPKLPVDRRFVFAGLADRLVPPDHVLGLWEHWERPRIAWYHGSHLSFHWEPEVRRLIFDALVRGGLLAPTQPARARRVA
jgi:hypothetical protein